MDVVNLDCNLTEPLPNPQPLWRKILNLHILNILPQDSPAVISKALTKGK